MRKILTLVLAVDAEFEPSAMRYGKEILDELGWEGDGMKAEWGDALEAGQVFFGTGGEATEETFDCRPEVIQPLLDSLRDAIWESWGDDN